MPVYTSVVQFSPFNGCKQVKRLQMFMQEKYARYSCTHSETSGKHSKQCFITSLSKTKKPFTVDGTALTFFSGLLFPGFVYDISFTFIQAVKQLIFSDFLHYFFAEVSTRKKC